MTSKNRTNEQELLKAIKAGLQSVELDCGLSIDAPPPTGRRNLAEIGFQFNGRKILAKSQRNIFLALRELGAKIIIEKAGNVRVRMLFVPKLGNGYIGSEGHEVAIWLMMQRRFGFEPPLKFFRMVLADLIARDRL